MIPYSETWQTRLAESLREGQQLLVQTSTEKLNAAPPAGEEWTAAQHVEHLCIVTDRVGRKIAEILAKEAPAGSPKDWQPGWFSRWFIAACGPQPAGRTNPAPPIFLPAPGPYPSEELLERFTQVHEQFLQQIIRAQSLQVDRILVPSAAMPLMRLNLGTWLEAITVHTAYHLSRAAALVH